MALSSGSTIPATGSCTVTVNVTAAVGGSYINTLPAGALEEMTVGIGKILSGELIGRAEGNFAGEGLRCDFGGSGVIYRAEGM